MSSQSPPTSDAPVFRIAPNCTFKVTPKGALAVKVAQRAFILPQEHSSAIGRFLGGAAVALGGDDPSSRRLAEVVDELEHMGVLVRVQGPPRAEPEGADEFSALLNPTVLQHEEEIAEQIQQERAVVIRHAFREHFASRLRLELDRFDNWTSTERLGPHPHYRHHAVKAENADCPALAECHRLFQAGGGRQLAQRLSGRPCDGEVELGATQYLPGDFAMPHADDGLHRTLAFVWHLATDWDPAWGGSFEWGKNGIEVYPSFNTLILFRVSRETVHMVTPVSRFAKGKRLSVTGWWTRSTDPEPPAPAEGPPGLAPARYGPTALALDDKANIYAL